MPACKFCGGLFAWVKNDEGKLIALNSDGRANHWQTCAEFRREARRRKVRARKARGALSRAECADGPHVKTITGPDYRPSCECDVPPWESCPCSFTMAEQLNAEADARFQHLLDLASV